MDHSTRLIPTLHRFAACGVMCLALALVFAIAGCTTVQLQMRRPGEALKTFPEKVAEEYHCEKRPLPFFEVETNELLPDRVKPGGEFNHRMVYVLCPAEPTKVVSGTLETRVLYKGSAVFREVVATDLKPGRWVVDTFIPLPEAASPGIYALETTFSSEQGEFEVIATFAVEP